MGQCESLETIVAANEQLNFVVESTIMCTTTYVLAVLALFSSQTFAQVGIGTTSPHGSAALEVAANEKGILLPRLSTTQRDNIADPQPGLIVYNTTQSKFQGYVSGANIWLNTDNGSQSYLGFGGEEYVAQSFVASSSEAIYRIGARVQPNYVYDNSHPDGGYFTTPTVIAYIYEGIYDPNVTPAQIALATSYNVTITNLGEYNFDFISSFVPTNGTTYSIVFQNLSLPNEQFICANFTSSTYIGGNMYYPAPGLQLANSDLDIRIYTGGTWTDLH
jgi:hypothetical protein